MLVWLQQIRILQVKWVWPTLPQSAPKRVRCALVCARAWRVRRSGAAIWCLVVGALRRWLSL